MVRSVGSYWLVTSSHYSGQNLTGATYCSHILEPHVFQTPGRGFEQQYVVLIAFQTDSGDSGIWRNVSLYQF